MLLDIIIKETEAMNLREKEHVRVGGTRSGRGWREEGERISGIILF